MNTQLIKSIKESLLILQGLVSERNFEALDLRNLDKYNEKKLIAIDKFFQNCLRNISEFYTGYGKLLKDLRKDQEILTTRLETALVTEGVAE